MPWCLLLETLGGEYGVRVVVVVLYARDCSCLHVHLLINGTGCNEGRHMHYE